jgi:hypothetical protein
MDPKVAQSALNGNHYSRGIKALSLLSEVMFSLLWEEFLDNVSINKNKQFLDAINHMNVACERINGGLFKNLVQDVKDK